MYQCMSLECVNDNWLEYKKESKGVEGWVEHTYEEAYWCKDLSSFIDKLELERPSAVHADHFPGLVSFDAKAKQVNVFRRKADVRARRLTPMKIGRYLKAIGYNDATVRETSNIFNTYCETLNNIKLKIARTPEDCVYVYTHGPSSCMSDDTYFEGVHPASVYGNEYCGVAYCTIDDRIVARAVVSYGIDDTTRAHTTVYGNGLLLSTLLREAGYERSGSFEGVQLNKVMCNDLHVAPYLDCCPKRVDVYADHMLITSDGDYLAINTSGLLEDVQLCYECGEHSEDTYYIDTLDETVCCDCISEYVLFNETYYRHTHEEIVCVDGDYYHMDDDEICCDHEGDWVLRNDCTYSEYLGAYILDGDGVDALVNTSDYSFMPISDCTDVAGVWVYDEYLDEYNEMQGDLFDEA